jgi:hypothetical protein
VLVRIDERMDMTVTTKYMTVTTKDIGQGPRPTAYRSWLISAGTSVLLAVGTVLHAPAAAADPAADLRSAVTQMRTGTSCGALRPNPILDDVAFRINKSTQDYLDHAATQVPVTDPLPGMKVLGYPGTKAALLQGASKVDGNSIKGLLLQGFDKFPDCAYTEFGSSAMRNEGTGYLLTVAVLAGP